MSKPFPFSWLLRSRVALVVMGVGAIACSKSPAPPQAGSEIATQPPAQIVEVKIPKPKPPEPSPVDPPATDAADGAPVPSGDEAPATWIPAPGTAVLATETGLVAVEAATGEQREVAKVDAAWCLADARAGAVWFTVARESGDETVWDLGLVDMLAPGAPKWVARGLLFDSVNPTYKDEIIGRTPLTQEVVASLVVGEKPRFHAILHCEARCHEVPDDGAEDAEPVLTEPVRDQVSAIEASKLEDEAAVAALGKRATPDKTRRFVRLEDKGPVEVERGPCEDDEEACGTFHSIAGQSLGLVEVANTRGDFLYRQRQLFDTTERVFVDHNDPKKTSPTPFKDELSGWEVLEFGPPGFWLTETALVHRTRGLIAEGKKACGWMGPTVAADELTAGPQPTP